MKNLIIRNGLYASILLVGISFLFWLLTSGDPSLYGVGEVVGYTSIVFSMVFIYLGIRQYRDLSGSISFSQALKVGILIALFPSIFFGLYNIVYISFLDPDFLDSYYQIQLDQMKKTMPADAFAARQQDIEAQLDLYMNPWFQFLIMFLTVFIIGFIISIISSIIVKKKKTA
jgi:hypothetical protein